MLARIMGFSSEVAPPATMTFADVSRNAWFHDYIAWAYGNGFIKGHTDGTFRPGAPITRQELAAIIVRATQTAITNGLHFNETPQISPWARDYVSTAVHHGWMQRDTNGALHPRQHITRAEAVAFFTRAFDRGITNDRSLQDVSSALRIFNDVTDPRMWYFYYIVEASHSHWFTMNDGYKRWISIYDAR